MKRITLIVIWKREAFKVFFLLCSFFSTLLLKANEGDPMKHKKDSLLGLLSKTEQPAQQIGIYYDLILLSRYTPEEGLYSIKMYEMACKADSINKSYEALYYISRYYTNIYELDTLVYWVNKFDSITNVRKEYPLDLFQTHNALCRLYVIRGEFELAMNEAVKEQIWAEKANFQLGLACCNENWGLIYMVTECFEKSAKAFANCIFILKQLGDEYIYEVQVNECLIRSCLYLKEYQKAEVALNDYEDVLSKIEASDKARYKTYRASEARAILETYRIRLYSEIGIQEKVEAAIKRLQPHKEYISKSYILPAYNLAMASYYYLLKDYPKALEFINEKTDLEAPVFDLRAAIYMAMGKKQEALNIYQQFLNFRKSQNKQAYIKQIDQLRSIQKSNEDDKAIQKLSLQQKELDNKHSQLIALIIFAFILFLSLLFWFRYLIRTRKLKNILLKEQSALMRTNENLEVARVRAEKADKMKSNFIANISHEIRTPLNAIVGFTSLLGDSTKEERTEYMQVINNNSELLLNLVSDVLDLSRLEADNFMLHYQEVDIQECCQHALTTIRHRVNPGVNLVFTYSNAPYIMSTDPLRLQQLLVNLLTNAAKSTEEGEIHLDYQVDEAGRLIKFIVTDTGCGIPPDKQKIIFNRFQKLNEFKQGAGLGLSICRAISDRFAGRLYLAPLYTQGARFIFELPFSEMQMTNESNRD